MKIGYMRISKGEQTTALQEDALASAQCEKTFRDVMSGAKDERPQFLEMLKFARPGDTIVVWRLDRLGRSLKHLIETVMDLQAREINFLSLTESNEIPNVVPLADMMWFEMHGDLWERSSSNRAGCLLAVAHDVKEDGPDSSIPEEARWIVIATLFVSEDNHFFVSDVCHGLVIGFDGKPLNVQALKGPFISEKDFSEIKNNEWVNNLNPCLVTALFAMCFCHCKNITVEAEKASRQVRRAAERAKEPVLTLKTINIHPVKKVMTEEGQVERQGFKRALHICRMSYILSLNTLSSRFFWEEVSYILSLDGIEIVVALLFVIEIVARLSFLGKIGTVSRSLLCREVCLGNNHSHGISYSHFSFTPCFHAKPLEKTGYFA